MEVTKAEFERAYREESSRLLRLALAMTGNPDDASEVVQDAFCRAYAALPSFRGESSWATWLYRVCMNVATDRVRRRRRLPIEIFVEDMGLSEDEIVDSDPGEDPLTLALAEDIRSKCLFCFTECLPRRQRQVFCLSHVMGLAHREIGDILGIESNAVKASLFRARKRLDGYLNDRCEFIRADNPCSCRQWVRFGTERGIVFRPRDEEELRRRAERVKREIGVILDMRALYRAAFDASADELFSRRLRDGIAEKRWLSL